VFKSLGEGPSKVLKDGAKKDHPVAFHHPCSNDLLVFIGGGLPHWVIKVHIKEIWYRNADDPGYD